MRRKTNPPMRDTSTLHIGPDEHKRKASESFLRYIWEDQYEKHCKRALGIDEYDDLPPPDVDPVAWVNNTKGL